MRETSVAPPREETQKQIENGFSYPTRHWISNNWIYSSAKAEGIEIKRRLLKY